MEGWLLGFYASFANRLGRRIWKSSFCLCKNYCLLFDLVQHGWLTHSGPRGTGPVLLIRV